MPPLGPRRRPLALASLLLALLALPPGAAAQVDTSRRDALQRQVDAYEELVEARERELATIEERLGETQERLDARLAERDRIAGELVRLRAERDALREELATLAGRLEETHERIRGLEHDLEALKVRIEGLLVNLYTQRTGRFARVLGQAESFHELRVKNRYLSLLSRQDVALVEQLDQTIAQLFEAQQALSEQIAERSAKEAELVATQEELEETRAQLEVIIAELRDTEEGQLAARARELEAQSELERRLSGLQGDLQAEIERIRREEDRLRQRAEQERFLERRRELEAEADALQEQREGLEQAAAGFVLPVANPSVLTRFRQDNNSYIALRAGVAYAAVRAMQAGKVVSVALISANDGYMVSLLHPDGLVTAYTNLQPPRVEVGQLVRQGEVIGYIGGSALIPTDVLRLYVQRADGSGRRGFVDPAPLLGL